MLTGKNSRYGHEKMLTNQDWRFEKTDSKSPLMGKMLKSFSRRYGSSLGSPQPCFHSALCEKVQLAQQGKEKNTKYMAYK